MRKIIRQDPRIIQKLHRRVFIDKLTREQASLLQLLQHLMKRVQSLVAPLLSPDTQHDAICNPWSWWALMRLVATVNQVSNCIARVGTTCC